MGRLTYLSQMADTIQKAVGAQLQQQQPSEDNLFFKLLPELRNRIYELALSTQTAVMNTCHEGCCQSQERKALQPALSRTCKALRSETLPIFYGRQTFVVAFDSKKPAAEAWLSAIRAENRELLRDICVPLRFWERKTKMVELGSARAGSIEKALTVCEKKVLGGSKHYRVAVGGVEEG